MAVERGHIDLLSFLLGARCDINKTTDRGHFLLHTGVTGNSSEAIRLLLAMRADPNVTDIKGATPLMHAAYGGRLDALKALTTAPVNLDIAYPQDCRPFFTGVKRAGKTAIHLALSSNDVACVKELMRLRADTTIQDADGLTPLDLATSDDARSALLA